MTNYKKDEERRQYDPLIRHTDTLGEEDRVLFETDENKFDDISRPEHYCAGFEIEPLDFIVENQLDFLEGNIIKYVSRYDQKGGVKDLKKARFYIDKLIMRETQKMDA
jgi:hypothetical protein|tara:strand:+ start:446 stop:769 length:324 start_codon:yes stop_codon:yes gene_type:complete